MPGVTAGHLISKYNNLKGTPCQEANRGSTTISGTQARFPFWNRPRPPQQSHRWVQWRPQAPRPARSGWPWKSTVLRPIKCS